jgi:hypothetical protein
MAACKYIVITLHGRMIYATLIKASPPFHGI